MTDTDTTNRVDVEGDVFLPTTEPVLSVVAEGDEVTVETSDETITGTVEDKEYIHEAPSDLPNGLPVESAYRVDLCDGHRQLLQGAHSNVLYAVSEDDDIQPANTISISRD